MTKLSLLFVGACVSASAWGADLPTANSNDPLVHIAPYRASMTPTAIAPAQPVAVVPTSAATAVKPVVADSLPAPTAPVVPELSVSARDGTLRAALERWLAGQHWQLAWEVDSDLPLEFDAQFTGNFDVVLRQAMQATNHMRQPTRACIHPNAVVRIIARAANCTE